MNMDTIIFVFTAKRVKASDLYTLSCTKPPEPTFHCRISSFDFDLVFTGECQRPKPLPFPLSEPAGTGFEKTHSALRAVFREIPLVPTPSFHLY
jgi:hypothetical protein